MAKHRYFVTSVMNRIEALQAIAKIYRLNNLVTAAAYLPRDVVLPLELKETDYSPTFVSEAFGASVTLNVQSEYDENEKFYIDREKRIEEIQKWYNSLDEETQKKVSEYASLSQPFA